VDVTGTLAASQEGTVSIEADGRIVDLRADLGDKVRRGTVLARVASEEYRIRLDQARVEQAAAEADFRRVEELSGKNLASRQQLDEARRRLDMARTNVAMNSKKLADTSLEAPFDGTIARRMVNAGEYVRTGTPAFVVVRTMPLKFKGDVPERYSGDVAVGNEVLATVEAAPGHPLAGRVARVSPSVAVETRSFAVEAEIDNPDDAVKPGSFARLSIRTGKAVRYVTVPESAVGEFAGASRVFLAADGKAKEQPIEVAGKSKGRVLVTKGLEAGAQVVVSGVDQITDGRTIQVRP
jgi:membrane fusion protein (multidrug efflux system)